MFLSGMTKRMHWVVLIRMIDGSLQLAFHRARLTRRYSLSSVFFIYLDMFKAEIPIA